MLFGVSILGTTTQVYEMIKEKIKRDVSKLVQVARGNIDASMQLVGSYVEHVIAEAGIKPPGFVEMCQLVDTEVGKYHCLSLEFEMPACAKAPLQF